jgi:hypothetical protein
MEARMRRKARWKDIAERKQDLAAKKHCGETS